MMSTQNQVAEHGVIHSSIALLQERFKQLQRVKEMREKKQLLTLFSHNYNLTPDSYSYHDPTVVSHQHNNNNNNNNNHVDDVVMVDDDDDDDDDLQIFLPPNYYYYSRNTNNNKPTTSCYSSSFSNYNNNLKNDNINNLSEISLSLWPPAMSYTTNKPTAAAAAAASSAAGGGHLRQSPLSTALSYRPPSSCVSAAFKIEDSQHVSDVDTTLHL